MFLEITFGALLPKSGCFNEATWRTASVASGRKALALAVAVAVEERRPPSVRSSCAATSDLPPQEVKPEETPPTLRPLWAPSFITADVKTQQILCGTSSGSCDVL